MTIDDKIKLELLKSDPDTGKISEGHICKHGIRYPHECKPCADLAYERYLMEKEINDMKLQNSRRFELIDVNHINNTIKLREVGGTEEVKFTFEFFQDVNKYITKEWNWNRL